MKKPVFMLFVLLGMTLIIYFYLQNNRVQNNIQVQQEVSSQTQNSNFSTISNECSGKAIPQLTEGAYYKKDSPEQQTIRKEDTPKIKLTLEGHVFDTNCQPIANAWIDFWQADGNGNYDNSGYLLRGHQYTDSNGIYKLETVVPGLYPGRTEHIHFKIKASETSKIITSQLFLPSGTTNSSDSIFDSSLVINMKDSEDEGSKYSTYNFVIDK